MINNRCSVCDWNPMGMCVNYEIDKFVSKGHPNMVIFENTKRIFICLKCINAIELVKEDYRIKDEEEATILLQDFSDEEIARIEKEISS